VSEPIDLTGWSQGYSIESGDCGFGVKVFVRRPLEAQKLVEALSPDDQWNSSRFLARAGEMVYAGLEAQVAAIDPGVVERRTKLRKQFQEIFEKAGFGRIFLREIPNEYEGTQRDGSPLAAGIGSPWYLAVTFLGSIKIGWRRSVISIEWKDTVLGSLNSQEFLPPGDSTRWDTGVHAYGYEQAARYLQAVYQKAQTLLAQESK
jgi:hypothetical protein